MLRIGTQCDVEESSFRPQKLLINFIADDNLEQVVEEDGEWTPEHGKVIVNALIAGIAPLDFKQNAKKSAEYARIADEPGLGFEIMSEDYLTCTRRAQRQQPAAPTYQGG